MDAMLLVIVIGMLSLRRWAALLASVIIAVAAAIGLGTGTDSAGLILELILVAPLLLTVLFWKTLTWGDGRREALIAASGITVSAVVNCLAFLLRHL
jgi:hypothetical protein